MVVAKTSLQRWIASFFLPIVRELHVAINLKIISYVADGDFSGSTIYTTLAVTIEHTAFLAFTVGSTATPATSFLILGIDFITNIIICLRLLYLRKQDNDEPCNDN